MASKHLYTLDAGGTSAQVVDYGALRKEETAVLALDSNKLGGKEASAFVQSAKVVNNFTTTEEGFVADARTVAELNNKIASKRVTRIGYGLVGTAGADVLLSESIDNFDLMFVGITQTSPDENHSRFNFPPVIVTPDLLRMTNSQYLMPFSTDGNFFYYVDDTTIHGQGTFDVATLSVFGIKL